MAGVDCNCRFRSRSIYSRKLGGGMKKEHSLITHLIHSSVQITNTEDGGAGWRLLVHPIDDAAALQYGNPFHRKCLPPAHYYIP